MDKKIKLSNLGYLCPKSTVVDHATNRTTLLNGFLDSSWQAPPVKKPAKFCKYVPNEHNVCIEGVHYPSERFQEIITCPLLKWAESNQGRLGGFYYQYNVMTYCKLHKKNLPRCPIMEWVFNNDNNTDLINSIIEPPFTPIADIPGMIQLLGWFICEKIVVPENGDIQPEHHRFLFYAYTEWACIKRVFYLSLFIDRLLIEYELEYPVVYSKLNGLAKNLANKAREADSANQQSRQQGWMPYWMNTVKNRLFFVKEAAITLRAGLLQIDKYFRKEAEKEKTASLKLLETRPAKGGKAGGGRCKKTLFEFSVGQVAYKNKNLPIPTGRTMDVLKQIEKSFPNVAEFRALDKKSSEKASEKLRGYISKINTILKTTKVPYTIKAIRSKGYLLTPKK